MKPLAIRIDQTCQLTNLSRTKIYELLNERILTRVKVGRRTLVTMASVEALITKSKVESE